MSSAVRVVQARGSVCLKGPYINNIATKWTQRCSGGKLDHAAKRRLERDGNDFHLTVISASELKTIQDECGSDKTTSIIHSLTQSLITQQSRNQLMGLYDLGMGCHEEQCYFVVIFAPFLQKTRIQLKLPPIDFHITCGFNDNDLHTIRKGFSTLWTKCSVIDSNEMISKVELILRSKSSIKVREYLEYPRLAEWALQQGYLFGAYYLAKYQNNALIASDILEQAVFDDERSKKLMRTTTDVYDNEEINYGESVCKALNHSLYSPLLYHRRLRRFYSSVVDINSYDVSFIEMPRNFSFVTDRLAGCSLPDTRQALINLATVGITDIITVMEAPLDSSLTSSIPLNYYWFEVQDRTPPTLQQMKEMMEICDNCKGKVLVHCLGGVGRTATVLAAYLMWSTGVSRQLAKQPLIDNRRTIIASSQDDFLATWYSTCLDRNSIGETTAIPPRTNPSTELSQTHTTIADMSATTIKFPPLILCAGYPASGKSTFSETLCSSYPEKFVRINQDEMGRRDCETCIGKYVKEARKTVILDRCNLTVKERKEWLALAHNKKAWLVHFSTPIEECRWRIVRRVGHPTLKEGRGGRVIDSLAGTMEDPNPKIENFEKYFEVHSFDSCNELLKSWGGASEPVSTIPEELGMLKFPRTRHLANLGSATRDDLLIPKDDVCKFFLNRVVLVEEKIDGANMGLSIRDNRICAQNRSHYVSSEYHPQFKYLEKWIHQHSGALWDILQSDRYILYGEWCYAKHSIPYDALSDWFTAFDLFDRLENKFWSRSRLEELLIGTGISLIPLIVKGSFPTIESLKDLVQTKSRYYDGPVEGIVVRVNDLQDEFVDTRGKIVRSDFLSGDTHWSKYGCRPNAVASYHER